MNEYTRAFALVNEYCELASMLVGKNEQKYSDQVGQMQPLIFENTPLLQDLVHKLN